MISIYYYFHKLSHDSYKGRNYRKMLHALVFIDSNESQSHLNYNTAPEGLRPSQNCTFAGSVGNVARNGHDSCKTAGVNNSPSTGDEHRHKRGRHFGHSKQVGFEQRSIVVSDSMSLCGKTSSTESSRCIYDTPQHYMRSNRIEMLTSWLSKWQCKWTTLSP